MYEIPGFCNKKGNQMIAFFIMPLAIQKRKDNSDQDNK